MPSRARAQVLGGEGQVPAAGPQVSGGEAACGSSLVLPLPGEVSSYLPAFLTNKRETDLSQPSPHQVKPLHPDLPHGSAQGGILSAKPSGGPLPSATSL